MQSSLEISGRFKLVADSRECRSRGFDLKKDHMRIDLPVIVYSDDIALILLDDTRQAVESPGFVGDSGHKRVSCHLRHDHESG